MVLSFLTNDAEMFMPKPPEDRSLSRERDVPSTGSCDWSTGRYWLDEFLAVYQEIEKKCFPNSHSFCIKKAKEERK
ncbi:hypothetical protein CEXT_51491 [Caerostris extrusa]|uniref:Uncharacterized protein n=1 Tax=Caerostris extrusa TaxID=172846 RepID=A0AAV4N4F2_CAEEX|nr:hypothetical protein CEXT_51491 [Caerostris extrusa]